MPNQVSRGQLEALAAGNDLILEATNFITVADMASNAINLKAQAGDTVRFTSATITFNDVADVLSTQGGDIVFEATGGPMTVGRFNSNGGDISMTSVNRLQFDEIISGSGAITLESTVGEVQIQGIGDG